jgi:hypothetical protein
VAQELDQRMAPDIQAIQEEITRIKAEGDTIWERVRMHGPATPDEREYGWRRLDELGRRTAELMAQQQGLRREHLHGLLSELRSLGQAEARWHPGTNRQARAAIEDAMRSLLTSWLGSSRDTSPIGGKIVKRGFYDPARQTVNLSKRGGPKPFESVAFHELGHRFEDSVPGCTGTKRIMRIRAIICENVQANVSNQPRQAVFLVLWHTKYLSWRRHCAKTSPRRRSLTTLSGPNKH